MIVTNGFLVSVWTSSTLSGSTIVHHLGNVVPVILAIYFKLNNLPCLERLISTLYDDYRTDFRFLYHAQVRWYFHVDSLGPLLALINLIQWRNTMSCFAKSRLAQIKSTAGTDKSSIENSWRNAGAKARERARAWGCKYNLLTVFVLTCWIYSNCDYKWYIMRRWRWRVGSEHGGCTLNELSCNYWCKTIDVRWLFPLIEYYGDKNYDVMKLVKFSTLSRSNNC